MVFGGWPERYSGTGAFVATRGLLGWFVQPPAIYNVTHLHGIQLLTWNLFVVAGSLLYLIMVGIAAGRFWRRRRRRRAIPPPMPTGTDALLARADAVLKRDTSAVSSASRG